MAKEVKIWFAVESPASQKGFAGLVRIIPKNSGIILRFGLGISPLGLVSKFSQLDIEPALMLHLRDENLVSLESTVRGALFLGVKKVFIGEPYPLMGVPPVSKIDGPAFVRMAKGISGSKIAYGVFNRLSHKSDLILLEKYLQAGVKIVAVPPDELPKAKFEKIEVWLWGKTAAKGNSLSKNRIIDLLDDGPGDYAKFGKVP